MKLVANLGVYSMMQFDKDLLIKELRFKTSRSGGKGGQHVNKVSSKVELNFEVASSEVLTSEQKAKVMSKLAGRINSQGVLQIVTEEDRSQLRNKERGISKLFNILEIALRTEKPRKATRPRKAAVARRLKEKQMKAFKKLGRSRQSWE